MCPRQLHSSAQYRLEVVVAGDPPDSPGSLPQLHSDVVGDEQTGRDSLERPGP